MLVGRARLETFYRGDGRSAVAHALVIERAGTDICGEIFQKGELCAVQPPPLFSGSQQSSTDALVLVPAAYRDFRDTATDHLSVHWVRRSFEAGVYKSNHLTAERRHQSDTGAGSLGMLPAIPVTCRYGLERRDCVALRLKGGVILRTLEEDSGNPICIP